MKKYFLNELLDLMKKYGVKKISSQNSKDRFIIDGANKYIINGIFIQRDITDELIGNFSKEYINEHSTIDLSTDEIIIDDYGLFNGTDIYTPLNINTCADYDLFDSIDGLFAYDSGCVDSGIKDEALRLKIIERLKLDDSIKILTDFISSKYLSYNGRNDGYTIEDIKVFIDWLDEKMDIKL